MSKPSHNKRGQVICTIGPACRSRDKIAGLIRAGMDVARLHCSYSGQAENLENIRRIREAARELRRPVKILLDLTGAKVRLGNFARGSVELKAGAEFTLTARPIKGSAVAASISIPELISVVKKGDTIWLADGELVLKTIAVKAPDIRCRVIVGGRIKEGQAVHVPGKATPVRVPTAKDLDDVRFGLEQGVDWIGLSYAITAAEVNHLREFIRQQGAKTLIVVKIERQAALENLTDIVHAADLVMVARGDLGLEIPLEEIGVAQKKIIRAANRAGKPVITATEMMFSMMDKNRPLRAEVTDVSNAIWDGSDAVMLSGETAIGHFPVEAARMAAKIVAVASKNRKQFSNRTE